MTVKLGKEFKPSPKLVPYTFTSTGIVFGLAIIPFFVFLFIISSHTVAYSLLAVVAAAGIIFVWWVKKFYTTVFYKITGKEITARSGVWFRKTSIVPHSRITNIDLTQGPVERLYGISTIIIQTAGYSGTHPYAEIKLAGLENPGEVEKVLQKFLK
jgi:membrane protein YdbS with pleckstrin-like domain